MIKIYVDTEEEKKDLINQSRYIHDFIEVVDYKTKDGKIKQRWIGLDSDRSNFLMHIYMSPEIIIVGKHNI